MATSDVLSIPGIVLRITPVKESDAMVFCLGNDGFFTFYAHGGKKLVSANSSALQPYVEASFLCRKSSSGSLTLKEASRGKMLVGIDASLEAMSCASIIGEIASKLIQEDDGKALFPYLEGALKCIGEGKDPFTATLIFFAHTLNVMGYGLNVDECVLCGRKDNITAFSYQEGGFVCEECASSLHIDRSPLLRLKVLRYAFKAPLNDFGRVSLDHLVCKSVLNELGRYCEDLTGVHLKSVEFLFKI